MRRKKLIFSVKLFKLLSEWEVLLLQVNRLEHTHVGDLLQGHRMYKETRLVRLRRRLWSWFDTPDEVQLALFFALRNRARLLWTHSDEGFAELVHQIIHLASELLPDSLILGNLLLLFFLIA